VTTCAFAESSNNRVTIIGHSTHTVMVKVITFRVSPMCSRCAHSSPMKVHSLQNMWHGILLFR
jgi:hypothetical protein